MMRNLSPTETKELLAKHAAWLRNEAGGSRANLSGADLSRADLYGANLSGADLSRADLSRANLSGADLSGADLSRADLSRANLSGANLYGADLYGANLYGANLYGANLSGANLSGADLYGVKNTTGEKGTKWGSPASILGARWGILPSSLGRLAIALDAANHPKGKAPFKAWVIGQGYPCPYAAERFAPLVNFTPDYTHFDPKAKAPSVLDMALALLKHAATK